MCHLTHLEVTEIKDHNGSASKARQMLRRREQARHPRPGSNDSPTRDVFSPLLLTIVFLLDTSPGLFQALIKTRPIQPLPHPTQFHFLYIYCQRSNLTQSWCREPRGSGGCENLGAQGVFGEPAPGGVKPAVARASDFLQESGSLNPCKKCPAL